MPRQIKVQVTADTAQAKGQLGAFGSALNSLEGFLRKLGPVGNGVADMLDKIGPKGITAAAGVGMAAAAVGAAAKIAEDSIGKYVELGQKIEDYSHVTGLSAEESSRQVIAFQELGVSAETAQNAMFKLGKAAELSEPALNKVGITVARDLVTGNVDLNATLLNVINAWQGAGSAAEQNAILFAAFGRAGQSMIPILQTNSAELARLEKSVRTVYSEDDIAQVREYKIQLALLKQNSDDLGISLGRLLFPAQKAVISGMNEQIYVSQKLQDEQKNQAFGGVYAARAQTAALEAEYQAAQDARTKLDQLAQSQLQEAQAAQQAASDNDALYTSLHKLEDASFAVTEGQFAINKALTEFNKDATAENLEALEKAYFREAEAQSEAAAQQAEWNGETLSASDKAKVQIDYLEKVAATLDPKGQLYQFIEGYIAKLKEIPTNITTAIGASNHYGGETVTGHGVGYFAGGGTVPGPLGSPMLAVVHGQEQIYDPRSGGAPSGRPVVINLYATIADGPAMVDFSNRIAQILASQSGF